MAGIHTINLDGSNDQQVSTTGYSPSWQAVASNTTDTTQTNSHAASLADTGANITLFATLGLMLIILAVVLYAAARLKKANF